ADREPGAALSADAAGPMKTVAGRSGQPADWDFKASFKTAVARIREHQQQPGYWLTDFTNASLRFAKALSTGAIAIKPPKSLLDGIHTSDLCRHRIKIEIGAHLDALRRNHEHRLLRIGFPAECDFVPPLHPDAF